MSAPAFDGFSRDAFGWFAGLQADDSTRWFAAHHETCALKTAPRGYPRVRPLRHKSLVAGRRLDAGGGLRERG